MFVNSAKFAAASNGVYGQELSPMNNQCGTSGPNMESSPNAEIARLNNCGINQSVIPGGADLGMASPVASLASPTSSSVRPQPARSPYEWMKKPSYQSQPEKTGKSKFKF
jgi:hypothetical protein